MELKNSFVNSDNKVLRVIGSCISYEQIESVRLWIKRMSIDVKNMTLYLEELNRREKQIQEYKGEL